MKTLDRLADDHARFNVLVPVLLGLLAVGRPLTHALEARVRAGDPRPERTPANLAVLYGLLGVVSFTRGLEARLAAMTAEPADAPAIDPEGRPPAPRELLR